MGLVIECHTGVLKYPPRLKGQRSMEVALFIAFRSVLIVRSDALAFTQGGGLRFKFRFYRERENAMMREREREREEGREWWSDGELD